MRGAWHKVAADPVLKFFVVGVTFYGMSTFEGPMLCIKSVNGLSHYTDWTIAHVHSGALGWNGMMTFGMLYWLMPRIFPNQAVEHQSGIAAFLDRNDRHPAVHHSDLRRRFDARSDVASDGRHRQPGLSRFRRNDYALIIPMWWLRVLGGLLYVAGDRVDGRQLRDDLDDTSGQV